MANNVSRLGYEFAIVRFLNRPAFRAWWVSVDMMLDKGFVALFW